LIALRTVGVMVWFAGWFFVAFPWCVLRLAGWGFAAGWQVSPWPAKALTAGLLAVLLIQIIQFVRRGRGTPAPFDPPRNLVAGGVYERSRNPMYLLYTLIILAEAWLFVSLALVAYAVAFFGLAHLFVVRVEEPGLRRRFGAPYEAYCARVPRWLGFSVPP
jgi:protein-S-isoprenylcysteine O-methyltransferase Ste14